jgi:hypothetical protein
MTPGFSMMGSGIYSTTITREIVCNERCEDCDQEGKKCDAVWEEDFETDDWGNVDQNVVCAQCTHTINYTEERE